MPWRYLRLGAWSIFLLDLVVLAQLVFNLVTGREGPDALPAVRGLTVIFGSVMLGIAALLVVSTWLRIREGLWISMGLGAVPLLWAVNAIFESLWE